MVFHLNLRAGPSSLRNLKTIPFLSKAIKTCIQLYKEFPDPKAKYGVRYSYYQSGWRGLESNVQDETLACTEKAEKNWSNFPFSVEKWMWPVVVETIFPSKTLWKLNKIDSAGFIVFSSFVFGGYCLRLCHGNGKVIYLYSPFTITSLSWQNNRGNIRSSLFPLLMIRSIQPQYFRQLMDIHTCAHTQPCYWWETYSLC